MSSVIRGLLLRIGYLFDSLYMAFNLRFQDSFDNLIDDRGIVPLLLSFLLIFEFCTLICDIRIYIPVQEHITPSFKDFLHMRSGPVPVFCKKQGHQLRMYCIVAAEIPFQEPAYQPAVNRSVVSREMHIFQFSRPFFKIFLQLSDLSGLPRPVKSFQNYKHTHSAKIHNNHKIRYNATVRTASATSCTRNMSAPLCNAAKCNTCVAGSDSSGVMPNFL